jgi:hypothetical protein
MQLLNGAKKIGPVNRPCDRPIDLISIASLIILVTSRLAGQQLGASLAPRTSLFRHVGLLMEAEVQERLANPHPSGSDSSIEIVVVKRRRAS